MKRSFDIAVVLAAALVLIGGCARTSAEQAIREEQVVESSAAEPTADAQSAAVFEPIDLGFEPPDGVEDLRTRKTGSDWPAFLGPRQDARSTETGIVWPESGPPILWHRDTGEGYSMPTVSLGRLFLFDRHGDTARLTALHSETGEELWRSEYPSTYIDAFEYSGGPRASPVVDGNRVYAFGVDGRLRCHRVTDGRVLWEKETEEEFGVVQNFFGVAASPVVFEDLLIVPIGGSPKERQHDIHSGEVEPDGSGIVAFDKQTGELRYRAVDDLASYSSPVLRRFAGEPRVLWFGRFDLRVMDPRDGGLRASFPWKAKRVYSVNAANPVTVGSELFLSESYEKGGVLLRYSETGDTGDLQVVWQDGRRGQAMANHWNTSVYHQGHLYGSSGEKSGAAELRAVEWSTGAVKWSQPGLKRSTLLYVDGHFVVLGEYGDLRLIEATPDAYREVGTAKLEAEVGGRVRPLLRFPSWNPPILSHGILYVRGTDHLLALDLIPLS